MNELNSLRDSDGDPDPHGIVEEFWPYDGPYSGWITGTAGIAIAQLTRYLNNATGKHSALPDVQTASRLVSNLRSAVYGYDQLFDQLSTFVVGQADDPTLYDDRDPDGQGGDVARGLAAEVALARGYAAGLRQTLDRAAALSSRLGNRTPSGELNGGAE